MNHRNTRNETGRSPNQLILARTTRTEIHIHPKQYKQDKGNILSADEVQTAKKKCRQSRRIFKTRKKTYGRSRRSNTSILPDR